MGRNRKKNQNTNSEEKSFIDGLDSFVSRYSAHLLVFTILLALVVRITALISWNDSIYSGFLIWDERTYQAWALKITQGIPHNVYDFSVLPAYLMAFVYKILSPNPEYVRIVNIIFGIVTCWIIYLIGTNLVNKIVGLISCFVAALYKPFIFFNITLLKESLVLLLFSATIYFFLEVINKQSIIKLLLLGIVAGLLINVRANAIVVIPFILVILILFRYREKLPLRNIIFTSCFYIIGLTISISPFVIRNYQHTGEISMTAIGGFNLYIANNLQNKTPYYRPVPFASTIPDEQAVHFIIEASKHAGKKLSPAEASSYWTKVVITTAIEQPLTIAWKLCQKTLALFNQFEAEDNYHIGFMSNFVPILKLPFFAFWFIFPLGIAGMALLFVSNSNKSKALMVMFAVYSLTMIIFFTNARIRIPLMVILIPFAVAGIYNLISLDKQFKNNFLIYLIAAVSFSFIEFLPIEGTQDMTAFYNAHAINLNAKGFEHEAIIYWKDSSEMNQSYSCYANLSLAGKFYLKKLYKQSINYINKVPDESFATAAKYELIGDIMQNDGKIESAIEAYKKSLEINSGQKRPRIKLIELYQLNDPQKALQEQEKLKYSLAFY